MGDRAGSSGGGGFVWRQTPAMVLSSTVRSSHVYLQQPDKHLGGVTYGAIPRVSLTGPYSPARSRGFRFGGYGPLLRADHDLFAAAALKVGPGQGRRWGWAVGAIVDGGEFAHASGARAWFCLRRRQVKIADGRWLGADEVVISLNSPARCKSMRRADLHPDAVSAEHDINQLLGLLRVDGTSVPVGAPEATAVLAFNLSFPDGSFRVGDYG